MSEHRLSEIVIERPRTGMRISSTSLKGFKKHLHKLTVEASEDGLLNPYMIKVKNGSKCLSDHLGPLRRFLRSKVGEPWDEVYRELSQQLNANTMIGRHVISHLWNYVEQYVELIDGIPYRKPHLNAKLAHWGRQDQFYIHPNTGILCSAERIPRERRKYQSSPTDVVILDNYHQYCKVNGIWYLCTFIDFPTLGNEYVDDVIKGQIYINQATYVKGKFIYAVSKQQCNKKQLKFIKNQLGKKH